MSILPTEQDMILGDCREVLPKIPDESVDCIITDPPWTTELFGKKKQSTTEFTEFRAGTVTYGGTPEYHRDTFDKKIVAQLHRVAKPGSHIYIFAGGKDIATWITLLEGGGEFSNPQILIWHKHNATWEFGNWARQYRHLTEKIVYIEKQPHSHSLNDPTVTDLLHYPTPRQKWHPCQKPTRLIRTLIRQSTQPGELILDPYAGSGSTLIAARQTGRRALGIEISPEYVARYNRGGQPEEQTSLQKWLAPREAETLA